MDREQASETMIDLLTAWVEGNGPALEEQSVEVELRLGPSDRPKRGAALNLTANPMLAQLLLWETGEAELEVLDASSDTFLLREHRDLESEADLAEALRTLVDGVTRAGPASDR
jgi:hypothetical protein